MKLGLVLEGGASRGYFSCGVLDGLLEEGIIADYVIGTSAGIANAVSYASGQIGRNLDIAKNYLHDKRYMGFTHMLRPKNRCYYNLKFAFEDVPNIHVPFDYDAFAAFKGDVVAAVTNVDTGEAEYLDMPRGDRTFSVLKASCALPLLFPVITINGKKYMDGGICVPIPVMQAVDSGCDKNIVILTRERGYKKAPEKALQWAAKAYKKYPEFSQSLMQRTDRYNKNLKLVQDLESQGKAFVIAPEKIDGIRRTETDPEKLEGIYQQGYALLKENLPSLHEYLEK